MSKPVQIFIAYSRKDSNLLDELRVHFVPLERGGKVKIWYDGKIEPGAVWEDAIKQHLHGSDIILLLVSADAIASDYFYDKEVADALKRHEKGEARVVPLILRPCAWRATPLAELQALPQNGKPVTTWSDRDEAYTDAVEQILGFLEVIEKKKRAAEAPGPKKDPPTLQPSTPETLQAGENTKREGIPAAPSDPPEPRKMDPMPTPDPNKPALPPAIAQLEADMVQIAGGSFTMGWKDAQRDGEGNESEKPSRSVQVAAFAMSRYPVTQAQWHAVMGGNPSHFKNCDNCPVESLSWDDIQEFLQKLNALTGKKYRLPSEAEWEYAARGGNQSRGYLYSGSNDVNEVGWYSGNSGSKTQPVGGKKPNELGLYDMSGNVWEWCEDNWHDSYQNAPTDSRPWVDNPRGGSRVLRGGSWNNLRMGLRAADRDWSAPFNRFKNFGFRLARD